ncbi:hypothetical protein EAF04_010652 [Stromatinia cepivora]|nr:hypothetical protein EAF04_010652 [Stromatinia cepivora]
MGASDIQMQSLPVHDGNWLVNGPPGELTEKSNRDETEMAIFGKKQQLKRKFGFVSILGLTCTLMITWEGILTMFSSGLTNGGPSGLVYGYIIVLIGTMFQTLTMAEMALMIPLSGGQYNWVAILAPRSCSKYLSYLTGWVTVIGWQAATAGSTFLAATMVQGIAILNYPDYVPKPWQAVLLIYAILAFAVFINTYLASQLPTVESLVLIIHILGFFAIVIPLVHLAPHGTASDVFNTFLNDGNWSSNGLAFFVGLMTSIFALIGVDSKMLQ